MRFHYDDIMTVKDYSKIRSRPVCYVAPYGLDMISYDYKRNYFLVGSPLLPFKSIDFAADLGYKEIRVLKSHDM